MREQDLSAGLDWLADRGLNLAAVLRTDETLDAAPRLAAELDRFPSLLIVGSTGRAMWRSIQERGFAERPDPVDEHALAALQGFIERFTSGVAARIAWPDPAASGEVPVSLLGRLAGWSHRSPMGLGVHPRHGLWTAYRGVILLGAPFAARVEPASEPPCDACVDRPCIPACPSGAVGGADGLAVVTCFDERTRPDSGCADGCLARAACPVGPDSAYGAAQIAHHQRSATASLARWLDRDAPPRPPPEWTRPEGDAP